MSIAVDQTPIDVVAALADSPYKDVSKGLAEEFDKANIKIKGMVKNAPLRLKKTFGVDVYEVMRLICDYKEPRPTNPKKTKKLS